jgi:hypothetical protein
MFVYTVHVLDQMKPRSLVKRDRRRVVSSAPEAPIAEGEQGRFRVDENDARHARHIASSPS